MVPSSLTTSTSTPAGRQAGHPREVDSGLGVAASYEHAALAVAQREHVARAGDVPRLARRVGQHARGVRAVGGGDAGRDAVAGVDGDRVRRPQPVLVVRRHQRDLEPVEHVARHRYADHAAGVADRERHQLRRRLARREDDVALVLAVLVVDDDDGLAGGDVGDRVLDTVEPDRALLAGFAHRLFTIFSTYFAITSTSRLTTSPGCLKPSVVRARVSGIRLTVNDSGRRDLDHGQGDAVDGDRALGDEVALEVGRQGDLDDAPSARSAYAAPRCRCRRRGPGRCGRRAAWSE